MSLHTLANNLQRAGRGDDKLLVHMTPREVGGLQALAMAHGGSLTINPQTGLPEAGILSSLLPTVLGFALGPAGMGVTIGGLSSAASAGLISGAVGTLATGSLSKGLMAGLGAYGGASLGGSLMGAGGGGEFNPLAGATTGQLAQAFGGATPSSMPVGLAAATQGGFATPPINVAKEAAKLAPTSLAPQSLVNAPPTPSMTPVPLKAITDIKLSQAPDLETIKGRMSAVGQGLKNITSSPENLFSFVKENPVALAGLASSIAEGMQSDYKFPEREKGKPIEKLRYAYDAPVGVAAGRTSERNYFPNARFESTGQYYMAAQWKACLA